MKSLLFRIHKIADLNCLKRFDAFWLLDCLKTIELVINSEWVSGGLVQEVNTGSSIPGMSCWLSFSSIHSKNCFLIVFDFIFFQDHYDLDVSPSLLSDDESI